MTGPRLQTLDVAHAGALAALPFSYSDVGASRSGTVPDGCHPLYRRTTIGHGDSAFTAARESLLNWRVQLRSGVRVAASSPRVVAGAVAVVGVGVGRLCISGPVRVVDVVDTKTHTAFAYGTLPGHPESGEERFSVTLDDDGDVWFELIGFSRPASLLARAGAPVASLVQRAITDRYARSLIAG